MTVSSLHIIGAKKSGGAERFFIRLTTGLAEKGHPVHAIIPPGAEIDKELPAMVPRSHIKMSNVYDIFSRRKINKLINKLNPAIVQTYMGRATRLTHVNKKQPRIHIARLGGYYNLKGYTHADAWVGNTRKICRYLTENGFASERVFYIGNFTDIPERHATTQLAALRQRFAIPENTCLLLSVSRLHPNKAVDTLLQALSRLPAEIDGRPLHLLVLGEGPEQHRLHGLCAELGLASRVHWAGWQTQTSLFYQAADLFVCPSRHEPLGNVILEAWANQVPVVATDTDGAGALIDDGDNGRLVAIDAPDQLATAIRQTLSSPPQEIRSMVQRACETLQADHSKEAIVDAYLQLYTRLTEELKSEQ